VHIAAKFRPERVALAVSSLVVLPLLWQKVFIPCLQCYDFEATATHEMGHVLGLGHPNSAPSLHPSASMGEAKAREAIACDDQNDDTLDIRGGVPLGTGNYSIMEPVTQFKPQSCIGQDDLDGLNALYPTCKPGAAAILSPPLCVKSKRSSGVARLLGTFLIPTGVCSLVVFLAIHVARRYSKRTSDAVEAFLDRSVIVPNAAHVHPETARRLAELLAAAEQELQRGTGLTAQDLYPATVRAEVVVNSSRRAGPLGWVARVRGCRPRAAASTGTRCDSSAHLAPPPASAAGGPASSPSTNAAGWSPLAGPGALEACATPPSAGQRTGRGASTPDSGAGGSSSLSSRLATPFRRLRDRMGKPSDAAATPPQETREEVRDRLAAEASARAEFIGAGLESLAYIERVVARGRGRDASEEHSGRGSSRGTGADALRRREEEELQMAIELSRAAAAQAASGGGLDGVNGAAQRAALAATSAAATAEESAEELELREAIARSLADPGHSSVPVASSSSGRGAPGGARLGDAFSRVMWRAPPQAQPAEAPSAPEREGGVSAPAVGASEHVHRV